MDHKQVMEMYRKRRARILVWLAEGRKPAWIAARERISRQRVSQIKKGAT